MDDIAAIQQLSARYNRAGDDRVLADYLACFTVDGVFGRADTGETWTGEAQLRSLFGAYPVSGRHVTTDFVIDVDEDGRRATGTSYLQFFDRAAGMKLHMFGIFDDELVKQGGVWRFARRILTAEIIEATGS